MAGPTATRSTPTWRKRISGEWHPQTSVLLYVTGACKDVCFCFMSRTFVEHPRPSTLIFWFWSPAAFLSNAADQHGGLASVRALLCGRRGFLGLIKILQQTGLRNALCCNRQRKTALAAANRILENFTVLVGAHRRIVLPQADCVSRIGIVIGVCQPASLQPGDLASPCDYLFVGTFICVPGSGLSLP